MSQLLFTRDLQIGKNNTRLSFYKHHTILESYYCIICTSWGAVSGTYTMRTENQKDWRFAELVPKELKAAEAEISIMISDRERITA